jgi:hypothetical protein
MDIIDMLRLIANTKCTVVRSRYFASLAASTMKTDLFEDWITGTDDSTRQNINIDYRKQILPRNSGLPPGF